ncbi:MAG: exo-beta-N-acetylmuramidase NamZ family protein, partial [Bacteroidales bacterium]
SLYGNHRKPTQMDLENVDIVMFDIQDVGVRFYTYISTLTLVMEACAESDIPVIVADRPNPNGFYVDGPVLDTAFSSFVGMHPVPIVYGMTIGEYATMLNGEKWLQDEKNCGLTVIKCKNYTHHSRYQLPVAPSPNLQDMNAIYLYPSLCLFEGTVVSIGRGTDNPFKVYGHPLLQNSSYSFIPIPIPGVSDDPPLKGQLCHGQNLNEQAEVISKDGKLELLWLISAYNTLCPQTDFFKPYFDKLVGGTILREQIEAGLDEKEIRHSWRTDLKEFNKIREKYLLYPDFE